MPALDPPSRPTVLISVHQGFAARYLLRTGMMSALRAAGARIVVLTPNADEDYLRAELGDEVVVEPLIARDFEVAKGSRSWWLALHLRMYTLGRARDSPALLSKYAGFRRRLAADHRAIATAFDLLIRPFRRSRVLRRALLAYETRRHEPGLHAHVFDRHRPDLVLTSSPGWFLPDAVILREARARGVRTAAIVAAWDNPTSKGYRGADPDVFVVWSDRMADQLRVHHDVPADRILVAGNAHFDRYVREGALWDRTEVDERLGLDPARRIVVFATSTPGAWDRNVELAEILGSATEQGQALADAQVVVRLHPVFLRADHSPPLAELEAVRARHPHLHLDVPDVRSKVLRCDLSAEDNVRFSSLLSAADALVCVFSTTALEACLADVPVVFVSPTAYSDDANGAGPAWQEYLHLRQIVETGAARVGRTRTEVIDLTRRALDRPELDRDARRAIAIAECGPTDGFSGERLARHLLQWIDAHVEAPAVPVPARVP